LIKRRGKLGLVKVDASFADVKEWLSQKMGEELQASIVINLDEESNVPGVQVGPAVGELNTFIVEPFLPHKQVDQSGLKHRC